MTETRLLERGGYRYVPGVFQYSCGVAAAPGFEIVRTRFSTPVPLAEGFRRIAGIIEGEGRPLTAFCACELRSPEPFTEAGFQAFNEIYAGTLRAWNLFEDDTNPVARSNVCPEYGKPPEPSFHAFCYTIEKSGAAPSFVVAGSGEAPEGKGNYRDHIIARGDVSAAGLTEKASWVLGEMERRMAAFSAGWKDTSAVQVYSVHDIHPLIAGEYASRGLLANGVTWHINRPPVRELEYEMDCRRIADERLVTV